MRSIIWVLIMLPSVGFAQTEEAEFEDLGEAAWRCAYLAAWREDFEEAKRLFDIGEQAYRKSLVMSVNAEPTQEEPTETQDSEQQASPSRDDVARSIMGPIYAMQRQMIAVQPGEWGSEPSLEFQLGSTWQEVAAETDRRIHLDNFGAVDFDEVEKSVASAFREQNCAWIR